MNYIQNIEKDLVEMLKHIPIDESTPIIEYVQAKILESYKNGTAQGYKNGVSAGYRGAMEKQGGKKNIPTEEVQK